MGWIDQVRTCGVLEVARALELPHQPLPLPGSIPCLFCQRTKRGHEGRRLSAGLSRDGLGFRCHSCRSRGDAGTLIALVVEGTAEPASWAKVRTFAREHGWCDFAPGYTPKTPPRTAPRPQAAENPEPQRPPRAEVLALWKRALRVQGPDALADVVPWFGSLDLGAVELWDLARVLPPNARVPRWARREGGAWTRSPDGYRLVFPMFDKSGDFRSLHARALTPRDASRKATNPIGYQQTGLVMSNALGVGLLRGTDEALERVHSESRDPSKPGLVLAEGARDFLVAATLASDADELAPAVFGLVEGSWSDAFAAKVPDGADVVFIVQTDPAGEAYWERVRGSLALRLSRGTVRLRRYAPKLELGGAP